MATIYSAPPQPEPKEQPRPSRRIRWARRWRPVLRFAGRVVRFVARLVGLMVRAVLRWLDEVTMHYYVGLGLLSWALGTYRWQFGLSAFGVGLMFLALWAPRVRR